MGEMADFINDPWPDEDYRLFDVFCKFCGRGPFNWVFTENGWRLETQERRLIHRCKQYWNEQLKQAERTQKLMEQNKTEDNIKATTHKFFIAGVQHHEYKEALRSMSGDETLILRAEPTNRFDPNAIRIELNTSDGDVMLGYVPKKFSSEISAKLTIGKNLECKLVHLDKLAKPWEMFLVQIGEVE